MTGVYESSLIRNGPKRDLGTTIREGQTFYKTENGVG